MICQACKTTKAKDFDGKKVEPELCKYCEKWIGQIEQLKARPENYRGAQNLHAKAIADLQWCLKFRADNVEYLKSREAKKCST